MEKSKHKTDPKKIESVENYLKKITQNEERTTKERNNQSQDDSYGNQTMRSRRIVYVSEKEIISKNTKRRICGF